KFQNAGMLVGGILLVLFLVLTFAGGNQTEMMQSYIYGFMFWTALTIGMLGVTLLHHTVRGSWGLSVLRMAEAGASSRTFLLLAILFLPIIVCFHGLYP